MSTGKPLTDDDISAVIERVANGMSLKKSCEMSGLGYANVVRRINSSETLRQLDAQAREDYIRNSVDRMHDVAATEPDVNRARLICDNIKWEAARIVRKVYGDKTEVDLNHNLPVARSDDSALIAIATAGGSAGAVSKGGKK